MTIPDKRFLLALLILSLFTEFNSARADASFEPTNIKAGARPLYGLVFGDFGSQYNNAPGGLVYARGLYRLNISNKLMLVPEFSWGILYLGHKSESGRELFLFPFAVNLYFDAPVLNFNTNAGIFALRPYVGLGIYLNYYHSPRTKATGGDFGYQAGINLEYRHEKMKGAYVEVSIDHMFATNFKRFLPMLAFSAGAGYAFEYQGTVTEPGERLKGARR